MKIACIVFAVVAVILGIVIVIVLLYDRKQQIIKTEIQDETNPVATEAEEAGIAQECLAVSEIKEQSEKTVSVEQAVSKDTSDKQDIIS